MLTTVNAQRSSRTVVSARDARSPVETRISPRTVVKTIAVIGVRRPERTRPKNPGTMPSSAMP